MRRLGLVAMLLLAGCTGGIQTGVYGGGRGLPDAVMKRATDEFAPPARGYVGVALRAFVPGADGEWAEVTGARCQVAAGAYRATAATPARVVMPDLGPDAPAVRADCASGAARGSAEVRPVYSWPEQGKPDAIRRVAFAGWWWGYQESGPMRYPDLSVGMR